MRMEDVYVTYHYEFVDDEGRNRRGMLFKKLRATGKLLMDTGHGRIEIHPDQITARYTPNHNPDTYIDPYRDGSRDGSRDVGIPAEGASVAASAPVAVPASPASPASPVNRPRIGDSGMNVPWTDDDDDDNDDDDDDDDPLWTEADVGWA